MADKILPTVNDAKVVRPESIPTPEGKTERRELRSTNSKTFLHPEKAADGKEIRTCQVQLGAVCYRDDTGELRSIDTTIRDLGNDEIGVEWAPYKMRLHTTGIGFDFQSREGGSVLIKLTGIGGDKFDTDSPLKPDITDNVITFRDVRPGCDIVFKCLNDRVKTLRILRDENAPRTFEWSVISDKPELIDSTLIGTDAAGNQLELSTDVDGDVIRETWTGTATTPRLIGKGNPTEPVYPLEIDPTITVGPGASADDGYDSGSTYNNSSSQLAFGWAGASYSFGVTINSVTVPQGATIDSSSFSMWTEQNAGTGGQGTMYGYAIDNAGQFSAGTKPSGVSRTTASTAIPANVTTGTRKTWTVTSIIQEIVNRAGWASGNSLGLVGIGSGSGTNYTQYRGYDYGSEPPSLSITYTAGGGTVIPVMMNQYRQRWN